MGKEKLLPVLAIIVLLIGTFSALYVNATEITQEKIKINNESFTIEELYALGKEKTITTSDGEKTGVSLEQVAENVGISCLSCNKYTIKASDGYQKTVEWNVFKTGILTKEKRVFFPDAPHALWVRDVIEIGVK